MTKKIAILYPLFLGGGAEAVTAWMLQVLKDKYDVTLFTFSSIDFAQLDRQFGTQLDGAGIHLHVPYKSLKSIRNIQGYSLMTIRQHLLAHYFRNIRQEFDLAIAAFNEMDLGQQGLQYIHVPLLGHGNEKARRLLHYPTSPLRTLYQRACETLTGYSDERMRRNVTLTNSPWTAKLVKQSYQMDAHVLYPPVSLNAPVVPWEERENGFICSGRISPDKNLESVIRILREVRESGHDVHIHILSGSYDRDYRKLILELQKENASWLFVEENLSRFELGQMLAYHRYGIHGRENETFGISVAEMVKAGCLPFVPASGGQAEIVGANSLLTFQNNHEAVEKIVNVLSDPEEANRLLILLKTRASSFSIERFTTEFLSFVTKLIE